MTSDTRAAETVGDFADATRRAFAFLRALGLEEVVAEYWPPGSFPHDRRVIATEPTARLGAAHVGFAHPVTNIAVDIYHDPRAEVQVAIGPRGDQSERFHLEEILASQAIADARVNGVYSSAETPVARVVASLAAAVEAHAAPWLRGDPSAIALVQAWRRRGSTFPPPAT